MKSALTIANSDLNQAKLSSKRIENKIQLVWIWDLKITCFKPKIDHIRLKSCRIDNCRQLAFEIGRKFGDRGVIFKNFHNMAQNYCKQALICDAMMHVLKDSINLKYSELLTKAISKCILI